MKKLISILCSIFMILTLSACEKEEENTALKTFREGFNERVAVAFFGYYSYDLSHLDELFNSFDAYATFPFLESEIEIVDTEGDELYLIVPKDPKASISVYENNMNIDTGEMSKGELLYKSPTNNGQPILVHANVSDIYSNVIVEVSDDKGSFEFSPSISLMDGKLNLYDGMIKDYTLYDKIYDNHLLEFLYKEDIYGEWSTNMNDYSIALTLSNDNTVILSCGKVNEMYTVIYEGTYKYGVEDSLENGDIEFNLTLKTNESDLELEENLQCAYQLLPFAYEAGFTMKLKNGQMILQPLSISSFEFYPTVG